MGIEVWLPLIGLGLALGLRHGFDWDHLAAIADLTGSATGRDVVADPGDGSMVTEKPVASRSGRRRAMLLASMYAIGHALLVAVLGALAIWFGAILPEWIDPVMERIVGATLIFLGLWIGYSIWRHGREFRFQSRWMAVFSALTHAWVWIRARVTGRAVEHEHRLTDYGLATAFGIGVIHGIGAETGSQALLLATAAGATTVAAATGLLIAFIAGLLISNSAVAALSVAGFASAGSRRGIYVAFGIVAAVFSFLVGLLFITGHGGALPGL